MFRKLGVAVPWTEQRPAEALDYCVDFVDCLAAGETLSSPVVTASAGITVMGSPAPAVTTAALSVVLDDGSAHTIAAGQAVIVWVSGGSVGTSYTISVSATTSGGRTVQRSFEIRIVR